MPLEPSGADFGTLQVLQDADGAILFLRGTSNPGDVPNVLWVSSVGEVQPGDVHAPPHEIAENFFGITRRTDRTNNLGAAVGGSEACGEIP